MARVPLTKPKKKPGKQSLMAAPSEYNGTRPRGKVPVKLDEAEHRAILREIAELVAMGYAPDEVPELFLQVRAAANMRLEEQGKPPRPVPGIGVVRAAMREAEEKILGLAREPKERVTGRQLFRLEQLRNKAERAGKFQAAIQAEAQIARIRGTYAPVQVVVAAEERVRRAVDQAFGGMSRDQLLALARGERPPLGGTVHDVEGEAVVDEA